MSSVRAALRSNLVLRVASAVVLAPAALAAVVWLPQWAWQVGIAVVAAVAAREIAGLARHHGVDLSPEVVAVVTFAITWGAAEGMRATVGRLGGEVMLAAFVAPVVVAFIDHVRRRPERRSAAAWAFAVAVPTYIGGLATVLIALRGLRAGLSAIGIFWVMCLFVLVWVNDSAAYLGGQLFGRHPIAPILSPKKTWEGAFVGMAATVLLPCALWAAVTAYVGRPLAPPGNPAGDAWLWLSRFAALSLAVSIAGPLGDLSHSFLKRQFGAKDSSNLIPGHGGLWDRIDSLLFCAPVVYVFARLLGA